MSTSSAIAWLDASALAQLEFIPWVEATNKTFVITGATGLIGGTVIRALSARNNETDAQIKIIALVRDKISAAKNLADVPDVSLIQWDASSYDLPRVRQADYVIHCAAPTASSFFAQQPLETIDAVILGTRSMLQVAEKCGAAFVFASSMEVYGPGTDRLIDESITAGMDTQNPRNSYPVAKVAAESLCTAFAAERGLSACIARLAQSFGPGVSPDDQRVFAEFARACVEGRDIFLHTAATKQNSYVYSADAAAALILLAFRGKPGYAYNVANEATLTSVRAMADDVAKNFGGGRTTVSVEIDKDRARNFRPDGTLNLDTTRLRDLGWSPTYGLMDMYDRLIRSWQEER